MTLMLLAGWLASKSGSVLSFVCNVEENFAYYGTGNGELETGNWGGQLEWPDFESKQPPIILNATRPFPRGICIAQGYVMGSWVK